MKSRLGSVNDIDFAIERAKHWIRRNTVVNHGIVITSKNRRIYQEVTGYYIPTLLQCGMQKEAVNYAKWLCKVQKPNGAWLSNDGKYASVFNTGQVLRGLIAIYEWMPEIKENILCGSDWLISNMDEEGRLRPTEGTTFVEGTNSELIHVYCLPPLHEIGEKLDILAYSQCVKKCMEYYKRVYLEDILNFNYLSHFYAYVIEAMVDLGEYKIAEKAMRKIAKFQRLDGAVSAYRHVHWICSTGLFQFAVIWFKLGDYKRGKRAFLYATKLQNKSGGWYGGYPAFSNPVLHRILNENITYFQDEEISWAVKYFFDALYYFRRII